MSISLREYQQTLYDKIINQLFSEGKKSVCAVLPTGGGKSVVIGVLANNLPGRNLILTHRKEILEQNSEWLENSCFLTAKKNDLRPSAKNIIAMVQTADARIKKYGIQYLGKVDNVILDEIQVDIFKKVFNKLDFNRLVGFTGTPVLNKRKTFKIDGVEFTQEYTLSETFEGLATGPTSQQLIDLGFLTQDLNYSLKIPNIENLKDSESNPDGFTSSSLNEVFGSEVSIDLLFQTYEEHCKGKKTIIFNPTTKTNIKVYEAFKKQGINCMFFDSVNKQENNPATDKPWTREEVIDWFRSQSDAVLINTNVFTTGFNVKDVEVVVMNRATKSLSLWIQCIGRGSRVPDNIYKPYFKVIDLGMNIERHGRWSMERDWSEYFYPAPPKRKRKIDLLDTWNCPKCDYINIKGNLVCEGCGHVKQPKDNTKPKKTLNGEVVKVGKVPLPKGNQIVEYCKRQGKDANFAFKLVEKQVLDLFILNQVKKSTYVAKRDEAIYKITNIVRSCYFAIIKSELTGANKKLNTVIDRAIEKIDKLYKYEKN